MIQIRPADLDDPSDAQAVVALTRAYAADPMGMGREPDPAALVRLIPGLRAHGGAVVLLAFDGAEAIGLATCFRGFSTFAARPLLNVHDLAVLPSHRGRGVGAALLAAVEAHARATGCCKVTLEVMDHNPARRLYQRCGYAAVASAAGGEAVLFLSKAL